jgi:hypothetical protein
MPERYAQVTFVTPLWKILLLACGGAGFVLLGLTMIAHADTTTIYGLKLYVVGWASVIFFGLAFCAALLQIFPRFRNRLTIGPDGFETANWRGEKRYRWDDVAGTFAVWKMRRTKLVVFDSKRAGRNLNTQVSGRNSSLPGPFNIPAEALSQLMNDRLSASRGAGVR